MCHVLVNGLCLVLKDYKVLTMILNEKLARIFLVVTIFEGYYSILEKESGYVTNLFFTKRDENTKHTVFLN